MKKRKIEVSLPHIEGKPWRKLKYLYQRATKGYSDYDMWNPGHYFASIGHNMITEWLEGGVMGAPPDLYDDDAKGNEAHKWEQVLREIAGGFYAVHALYDETLSSFRWTDDGVIKFGYSHEKSEQLTRQYERGMDLFKQYILAMWD